MQSLDHTTGRTINSKPPVRSGQPDSPELASFYHSKRRAYDISRHFGTFRDIRTAVGSSCSFTSFCPLITFLRRIIIDPFTSILTTKSLARPGATNNQTYGRRWSSLAAFVICRAAHRVAWAGDLRLIRAGSH